MPNGGAESKLKIGVGALKLLVAKHVERGGSDSRSTLDCGSRLSEAIEACARRRVDVYGTGSEKVSRRDRGRAHGPQRISLGGDWLITQCREITELTCGLTFSKTTYGLTSIGDLFCDDERCLCVECVWADAWRFGVGRAAGVFGSAPPIAMAGAVGGGGGFGQRYGSDSVDAVWIFPGGWLDEWRDFSSVRSIILSPVAPGSFRFVRGDVEAAQRAGLNNSCVRQ